MGIDEIVRYVSMTALGSSRGYRMRSPLKRAEFLAGNGVRWVVSHANREFLACFNRLRRSSP
jgi:hypothetical protein